MGKQSSRKLIAHLPLVLASTCAVVVLPMLAVYWLRESGHLSNTWAGIVVGVTLSLLASQAGSVLWKAKSESDLLFSELMLWGWVQRWRNERRLAAAADLLGLQVGRPEAISGGQLTPEQKNGLLSQLTSSLEARDQYTHGHSRRVARHAATIAKQMGLPRDEVARIRAAGAMHDVGKLETPSDVLHKAGRLSDEEYAIVKRHPVDGAAMVATLNDNELTSIVRHHHERMDGTGYPDGLAGEDIPLGARILAVADTFDAITSTRPYRHANPHKKALDILAAEAGTQLDPDAVRAFHACYSGRRPLAIWTSIAHSRPKLASMLGEGLTPAAASNVLATVATAAAVGAAAVGPLALATANAGPADPSADAASTVTDAPGPRAIVPPTSLMASLEEAKRRTAASGAERTEERERGASGTEKRAGVVKPRRTRRGVTGNAPLPVGGAAPQGGEPIGTAKAPARRKGRGNAYGRGRGRGNGNGNAYGHTKHPTAPPAGGNNRTVKVPKAPKLPAVPKLPAEPKVRAVPVVPKGVGKKIAGE